MDKWADRAPSGQDDALGWECIEDIEGCYNAGRPGAFPSTLDGNNRRVGMVNMIVQSE